MIGIGQIGAGLIDLGHGDDVDAFGDVVENDHLVIEGEGQVGDLAIVRGDMGQMLAVADGVVSGVTDRSAIERRQLGQMHGADGLDAAAQFFQRVCALELLGDESGNAAGRNAGVGIGGDAIAIGLDFEEGLGGQKAIAADFFAAHHAFKEAGAAPGVEFVKGGDGREGVAQQSAIDRDQLHALGMAFKCLEVGIILGRRGFHRLNCQILKGLSSEFHTILIK